MMTDEQNTARKLRAILSADVEGYSLLMANDEAGTVEMLKEYRKSMSVLIQSHFGRVVDAVGDNLLAEFSSAVEAVECAVEMQKDLKEKNDILPEDRRLEFRIGINIGDVIQDGDRIYGSGVNVAARIEGLAEPGGICIARNAYDHIKDKLELGYEYLGEHNVKNIKEPVRVYKVLMDSTDVGKLFGGEPKSEAKRWIWATIVVTLIALLSVVWHVYKHISQPEHEAASIAKMAFPLPQKPSIAVLPFTNMSGDPEQDFFSDGLTEEIITGLSKVPKLFIIARNSVFTYKGKPIRVNQVAEELGVKYVLEGSVKRSGNQVRITAQLIDALSGHHLWSERYNRNLNDIFAIYDEIALKIIIAMEVVLTKGEKARLINIGTENIDAYLKLLQGIERFFRFNSVDNAAARKLFKEAISIDPNYPIPYAYEARTHWTDYWLRFSESPSDSIRQGFESVQKAIALDGALPVTHGSLARFYLLKRQHQRAIQEAKKGIALQPNSADGHALMGQIFTFSGRPDEAIKHHKMSIRIDPFAPSQYYHLLGMAYREAGRYDDAIEACKEAIKRQPNNMFAHLILAATYSMIDKMEEAHAEKEEVLRINPNFNLERLSQVRPHIDPQNTARFISSLRKAGLPDEKPLPLPDKPSIAVLAFDNLSGDPSQEYFNDGISEEIITALSKTDQLFVIARNSSFTYKGKPVKVKQVSEELGVRYVLEGSVRKTEDRVRINAQLIGAAKDHHLWAERYDSDIKNIFALQDEITMQIVTALQIELTEGEQARMAIKRHKNLSVKLKVMEATSLWRKGTKESFIRYGQMAQEIIDMAPEYQWGYRHLAWYNWILAMKGKSPQESIAKAFQLAQKALSLDKSDPFSHALLGSVYLAKRQYEKAIAAGKRSVELEPNGAMVHALLGSTLGYAGKLDEAIGHLNQGIRLNPFPAYWYYLHLGRCYRQKGQYEEALNAFKKAHHLAPNSVFNHISLASIYVLLDRQEEAEASAKKVLELKPRFSIKRVSKAWPYKQADLKLYVDSLRKAGLPE